MIGIDSGKLAWAKQHDWFVSAQLIESSPLKGQYVVTAQCEVVDRDGKVSEEMLVTASLEELRDWAGY